MAITLLGGGSLFFNIQSLCVCLLYLSFFLCLPSAIVVSFTSSTCPVHDATAPSFHFLLSRDLCHFTSSHYFFFFFFGLCLCVTVFSLCRYLLNCKSKNSHSLEQQCFQATVSFCLPKGPTNYSNVCKAPASTLFSVYSVQIIN